MSTRSLAAGQVPGTVQGIMLLLPVTLSVMGIVILIPVLPQMMGHFSHVPNFRYLIEGGVLTMPALCVMLFSPLAGWLADLFGRRRILMISMVAYAFLGVAPVFLDDLYAIIVTRVGVGLCESIILTVSTTLISDYFKGVTRERWLASQTAVASVSALALIYVGGLLGAAYGWRGPFGIYLYSLLLVVGLWLFTWEPQSEAGGHGESSAGVSCFPWRRLTGICAITLFASVLFYTVQTQSSLVLSALGVQDPARLGLLTAIASLGVPLGTLIFRPLVRVPVGLLLLVEFVLIGASFGWMGKAPDPHTFVLAAGLNQIGCGMILPTLLTWATRGLPFEVRGRGNGAWQGTFAVGQFLSGVVITFLADHVGGLQPALVVLGVCTLVAAALALAGHLKHRNTLSATSRPAA